ncbi:MAG: DUF4276 family protein [Cyanobacteriota bacterium]
MLLRGWGHETFARALILNMAREASLPQPGIHVRSARGGHGRAITELKAWLRQVATSRGNPADLLVVLIDANSEGWRNQRRAIEKEIDANASVYPAVIVACPDPHIEAWCAADPEAFQQLFSCSVSQPPGQPGRHVYKRWLSEALEAAGELVLSDPMDIAIDLVPRMDLYRSGKTCPSLAHLITQLRRELRRHSPACSP